MWIDETYISTTTLSHSRALSNFLVCFSASEAYHSGDFEAVNTLLQTNGYVMIRSVLPDGVTTELLEKVNHAAHRDGSVSTLDGLEAIVNHGYCIDVGTNSETTGNSLFDENNWIKVSQSIVLRDATDTHIRECIEKIFGKGFCVQPWEDESQLRLVNDQTVTHAVCNQFSLKLNKAPRRCLLSRWPKPVFIEIEQSSSTLSSFEVAEARFH